MVCRFPFFIFLFGLIALLMASCVPLSDQGTANKDLNAKKSGEIVANTVNEGAARVEKLLVELSEARQANKVNPQDLGMASYAVSVVWVGELEPVIRDLAASCGMGFRVVGRSTSPILVSIEVNDMLILEVFRILGMQAGTRADVIYRSAENMVEIVYAEK